MSRILIVEDSPTQAEQLRWTLEDAGFAVEVAHSAEDALDVFKASKFDIVVSDIVLPGASGCDLCAKIRAGSSSHVPVVLVSSRSDPMTIVHALECGADNFLVKPYEPQDLLARINTALANQTLRASGKPGRGTHVMFRGKRLEITSDKEQILDLLLSTFEDIVRTNAELDTSRAELASANAAVASYARELERRVEERTKAVVERDEQLLRLQAKLFEVARLNSMGEMAAALAHELNQPLTAAANFLGAAEVGLRRLEYERDSPKHRQIESALRRAQEEALRAGEIIRRLRESIAGGDVDMRRENLSRIIPDAVEVGLANLPADVVQVDIVLEPDAEWVLVDSVRVQQVVVNLVRNAAEAMLEAGSRKNAIKISARRISSSWVKVFVADTGPGLPQSIADSAFSVPTTSKESGMGVGLMISKRIIESHGGTIAIAETSEQGTTFEFTLRAFEGLEE